MRKSLLYAKCTRENKNHFTLFLYLNDFDSLEILSEFDSKVLVEIVFYIYYSDFELIDLM